MARCDRKSHFLPSFKTFPRRLLISSTSASDYWTRIWMRSLTCAEPGAESAKDRPANDEDDDWDPTPDGAGGGEEWRPTLAAPLPALDGGAQLKPFCSSN